MADDSKTPTLPAEAGPVAPGKPSGPVTPTAAPAAQEQPSGIEIILGDILHNKALAHAVMAFLKSMLNKDDKGPFDQEQTASARTDNNTVAEPVPTGNADVDRVARTFAATFDLLSKSASNQQYEGQGPQLGATAKGPPTEKQVGG